MKRLLLITLIVMAFVLVGVLHGGYIQENGAGDTFGEYAYPGNASEKIPDIIFDSNVLPPALF